MHPVNLPYRPAVEDLLSAAAVHCSLLQQKKTVAETKRQIQVMNDHHGRKPCLMADTFYNLKNQVLILQIKTAGGLVEKKKLRFLSQRSRKHDFLPFSSAQMTEITPLKQLGIRHHCLAVSRDHPLAQKKRLTVEDLYGETLMLVKRGDSRSVDRIRAELEKHPQIHLEDTAQFYDMEVFNRCAQTRNVMLTLDCWQNVHPALVTIPADWDFAIPYGLLYAKNAPEDVLRFLDLIDSRTADPAKHPL